MGFLLGMLIGVGVGIIGVPIGLYILYKVKETKVRRNIKRMLLKNQFLTPIDAKDFDIEMWKDKINIKKYEKDLEELNDKIFKEGKYKIEEEVQQ